MNHVRARVELRQPELRGRSPHPALDACFSQMEHRPLLRATRARPQAIGEARWETVPRPLQRVSSGSQDLRQAA